MPVANVGYVLVRRKSSRFEALPCSPEPQAQRRHRPAADPRPMVHHVRTVAARSGRAQRDEVS